MTASLFDDDDQSYIQWLLDNPEAYVINMRRRFDPNYVILHRSNCLSVNRYPGMDSSPGGFTERSYRKVCGASITQLVSFLEGFEDGSYAISSACSKCEPE